MEFTPATGHFQGRIPSFLQMSTPSTTISALTGSTFFSFPNSYEICQNAASILAMEESSCTLYPSTIFPLLRTTLPEFIVSNSLVLDHCVQVYFKSLKKTKHIIPRIRRDRSENLWNSKWGIAMKHPNYKVSGSWEWKRFRNRFRMPPDAFEAFVQECTDHHIFGEFKKECRIPIVFKVLSCLRILARDAVGDDIDEHLNIGNSTVNSFFKRFLANCAEILFPKYVYVPQGAELDAVEAVYRRMGFPGCVGSMDCTHVFLEQMSKAIEAQVYWEGEVSYRSISSSGGPRSTYSSCVCPFLWRYK